MSEDLIRVVQSLVDSGKGEVERLRYILDSLQKEKPLDHSDQKYLQELIKETGIGDLTLNFPTSVSEASAPRTSDSFDDLSEQKTPKDTPTERTSKEIESQSLSRKKVAIVTIVVAAIVVAYAGLDVYAVNTLQFRPHHGTQYAISDTQLFIQSDVCNPSYFPASFNKYEINAFYKSESIEKADIDGSTISPKTFSTLNGVFTLNKDTILRIQQQNLAFDPSQAHITTTVNASIFGVIPFSVVKQYSSKEFQHVLNNGPPGSFSCA